MIRNFFILLFLIGCIAVYTFYEQRHAVWTQSPKEITTAQQKQAPDFTFTSLMGKTYTLSDFQGKAVVLNFWASWCAPCLVEFPQMLELAEMTQGKAVFLFVSVDEDKDKMNRFIKKLGAPAKQKNVFIAHDPEKKIAQELYQTYKLPETYLINSEGNIQDKVIGASVQWNDDAMQARIENLIR